MTMYPDTLTTAPRHRDTGSSSLTLMAELGHIDTASNNQILTAAPRHTTTVDNTQTHRLMTEPRQTDTADSTHVSKWSLKNQHEACPALGRVHAPALLIVSMVSNHLPAGGEPCLPDHTVQAQGHSLPPSSLSFRLYKTTGAR